jgi:hypothetical protein
MRLSGADAHVRRSSGESGGMICSMRQNVFQRKAARTRSGMGTSSRETTCMNFPGSKPTIAIATRHRTNRRKAEA